MQARVPHPWDVTPKQAAQIQLDLRRRLKRRNHFGDIGWVAGADIALQSLDASPRAHKQAIAYAGVIVYTFPGLHEVERRGVRRRITFPYVPGLLAFREGPALLDAFALLETEPDLLLFDAHGYSHPRRFGLASHLSVVLDTPGIGVAKSLLTGREKEPPNRVGAWTPLVEDDETIGAVLRTRAGVRPVYISIGHRLDLESAVKLTLACTDGYRIPKPTREADHFVARLKRGESPLDASSDQP